MIITGGLIAHMLAVDAENKPLEDVATPLFVVTADEITNSPHCATACKCLPLDRSRES
jgi:hypothetical protein